MGRLRYLALALSVAASVLLPSAPVGAQSKPESETLHVDNTSINELATNYCGFPVQAHEVGTITTTTRGDEIILRQNLDITFTNLETGRTLDVSQANTFRDISTEELHADGSKTVTVHSTVNGINYKIKRPGGNFVSAGRSVALLTFELDEFGNIWSVDEEELFDTPQLRHFTAIVCQALTDRPYGRASLSGTVTDGAVALPGVCAAAFNPVSGDFVDFAVTDRSGAYKIDVLAAGAFKIFFVACADGRYAAAWYRDKPSFETADVVTLKKNEALKNVNATLVPQGITGIVTNASTGEPLSDICVFEERPGPNPDFTLDGYVTGADGRYRVGVPYEGDVALYFQDCREGSPVFAGEWYHDGLERIDQRPITVTTGVLKSADEDLEVGGAISGRVTDDATGDPFDYVCVTVFGPRGLSPVSFALSGADGTFRAPAVPSGDLFVHFTPCSWNDLHGPEWYDDKPQTSTGALGSADPFQDGATPVRMNAPAVAAGIDAGLARQGITGIVRDGSTGAPIENGDAILWNQDPTVGRGATVGPGGVFQFGAVPSGDYVLEFVVEGYASKVVKPVHVDVGVITTVEVDLERAGVITGKVTDAETGEPVPDVCIGVFDVNGTELYGSSTIPDGTYEVRNLAPGSVKVVFNHCPFEAPPVYATEWYADKPDMDSADAVSVTSDVTTSGIDAALTKASA